MRKCVDAARRYSCKKPPSKLRRHTPPLIITPTRSDRHMGLALPAGAPSAAMCWVLDVLVLVVDVGPKHLQVASPDDEEPVKAPARTVRTPYSACGGGSGCRARLRLPRRQHIWALTSQSDGCKHRQNQIETAVNPHLRGRAAAADRAARPRGRAGRGHDPG